MDGQTTNPRVPRSVVEGVLGEQAARHIDTANKIAERNAVSEAKQKRLNGRITTTTRAAFNLAVVFTLAMACLEIWNAVVG
jgi:hypothetical protein